MAVDFYKRYASTHYTRINSNLSRSYDKRFYFWKSYITGLLPPKKSIKILEVGSGMGHNLVALSRLGYECAEGIDCSVECVNFCKSKGIKSKLVEKNETKFFVRNRRKFDVVILYDVIEHFFPDKAVSLINKCKRVLVVGGKLVICVPNGEHPLSGKIMYADVTHKFLYTEGSLLQLLENANCKKIQIAQCNSIAYEDNNLIRLFVKKNIMRPIAWFGELFWKTIGFSQGIIFKNCKPTLLCVCERG